MQQAQTDRRQFLATAGSAIAMPYVITSSALGAGGRGPASGRIVMATIGCGGQGTGDMRDFLGFPQVQMVAVCDVVAGHRERAQRIVNDQYKNQDCKEYNDFRDVLARPDIDAVLIGTPDHWHAIITIEACKAGKDVYCEKPECLTVREGRAMADAVRRYGRVFSGGSQRVLGDYGDWPRLVRGGALGTIKEVLRRLLGALGRLLPRAADHPARASTGRCGWAPRPGGRSTDSLINGGFRPFRDYSGGGMTDWGAHRFGAAMFAMGLHKTGPIEIIPPDGKDHKLLTYVVRQRHEDVPRRHQRHPLQGHRGRAAPASIGPPPPGVDMEGYKGRGGIFGDFLHCVQHSRAAVPQHRGRPPRDDRLPPGQHRLLAEAAAQVGPGRRGDRRRSRGQPLARPAQARAVDAVIAEHSSHSRYSRIPEMIRSRSMYVRRWMIWRPAW